MNFVIFQTREVINFSFIHVIRELSVQLLENFLNQFVFHNFCNIFIIDRIIEMSANDNHSSYVIIDDILIEILIILNVRQLLRLERVSKRFEYCVNYVLKRQKLLFIGKLKIFIIANVLRITK
jgi:hypothetical protein